MSLNKRIADCLSEQVDSLRAQNSELRKRKRSRVAELRLAALESLGYRYFAGPSGMPSDWILRQHGDPSKGFEWKGQEHYDLVGQAVLDCVSAQLVELCGLEPLDVGPDGKNSATVYASRGLACSTSPLLVLVCGSAPGGAAGVWGRSLCINESLHEGAMFDFIFRAEELGWNVLVADPNCNSVGDVPIPGSQCPQLHLQTVWQQHIAPCHASRVMMVAHSYG
jgi:hypothetical protein